MDVMKQAYAIAARAVCARLRAARPGDLDRVKALRRGEVAVFSGDYDQAEKVLARLKVPVTLDPTPSRLGSARSKIKVAFVNCAKTRPQSLVEALTRFVERGGTLVTSDWALRDVIMPGFPETLRWNRRSTGDEVVSIEPLCESLWAETVVPGTCPQWWLWGSHPIEVVDRERVRVEAASHDLLVKYDAPVVAAAFDWRSGYVFHVISHFWAKRSAVAHGQHGEHWTAYLRDGLRLSPAAIDDVVERFGSSEDVSFAALQSAVSATELVARLCARA
jgi:hypothetical protein